MSNIYENEVKKQKRAKALPLIESTLHNDLKTIAKKNGVSLSALINTALSDFCYYGFNNHLLTEEGSKEEIIKLLQKRSDDGDKWLEEFERDFGKSPETYFVYFSHPIDETINKVIKSGRFPDAKSFIAHCVEETIKADD